MKSENTLILFFKYVLKLLYGQDIYTNGYIILLILMLGNIAVAESAVYGSYITASGNQKKKIPLQFEASIVTILGIVILQKFGIFGAAISYLIAAIYVALRYTLLTKCLLKRINT